jgi:hypothetical protein
MLKNWRGIVWRVTLRAVIKRGYAPASAEAAKDAGLQVLLLVRRTVDCGSGAGGAGVFEDEKGRVKTGGFSSQKLADSSAKCNIVDFYKSRAPSSTPPGHDR